MARGGSARLTGKNGNGFRPFLPALVPLLLIGRKRRLDEFQELVGDIGAVFNLLQLILRNPADGRKELGQIALPALGLAGAFGGVEHLELFFQSIPPPGCFPIPTPQQGGGEVCRAPPGSFSVCSL